MKTREINFILAYPGTCVDIKPNRPDFTVVDFTDMDQFVGTDSNDTSNQTCGIDRIMRIINDNISRSKESILFIIPWSKEAELRLVKEKMRFTTILPKTHKAQEWFMRLVDLGYGFNKAAEVVKRWKDLDDYRAAYPYETVYHLNTNMELDFKDLCTLIKHGRIRVLELRIFLSDLVPYQEVFLFWICWCICMFIGLHDNKIEWLLSCIQSFAYTIGLNYVFKSTIMRRRDMHKNGRG